MKRKRMVESCPNEGNASSTVGAYLYSFTCGFLHYDVGLDIEEQIELQYGEMEHLL